MMVGSLGSIPFYTSADENVLLSGLSLQSEVHYEEHNRHNQVGMLEFTGLGADRISFDLKLSAFMGVNPTKMLDRLRSIHKGREAVRFVLGMLPIQGYWVITDMQTEMEYLHKDGTLLSADVNITLTEYIEEVRLPIITKQMTFTNRMATKVAAKAPTPPTPPTAPIPMSHIGNGTVIVESTPVRIAPNESARIIDNYKRGTFTSLWRDINGYYAFQHAAGPIGYGYARKEHFAFTPIGREAPKIPPSPLPVHMNHSPATNPPPVYQISIPPAVHPPTPYSPSIPAPAPPLPTAQPRNTQPKTPKTPKQPTKSSDLSAAKAGVVATVGLGVKVVSAVVETAKKLNVTEAIKNAVSNYRNYEANKAAAVTPVVVSKDRGVNPNSAKHASWIHTVK